MTGKLLTITKVAVEVNLLLIFDHTACGKCNLVHQIIVLSGVRVINLAADYSGKFTEMQIVTVGNNAEINDMLTS